ncbi:MAG: glycoside hydrolase family 3 C-terminal domain-containing protein [Clostridia bacterium]|nr:glycoside hydrolase family 3 C-terminal domain-containing protein [Clostridia bacterium]
MELLTKASYSDEVTERERRSLDVAYRAACESMVLLKNDGVLPFPDKRIAAYGAGVAHTIKGGTGSGEVNERHSVSILEGLRARGFEVTSENWLKDYEAEYEKAYADFLEGRRFKLRLSDISGSVNKLFANFRMPAGRPVGVDDLSCGAAEAAAGGSCVPATENCIYVISRQAGEGGDRKPEKGDYYLTDEEISDIRFCAEHYKRFVLVINCGSSVDMSFAEGMEGIGAILYIGQLGTQGGNAVADVLSGAVSPSGKLADTWARSYQDIPFGGEFGHPGDTADGSASAGDAGGDSKKKGAKSKGPEALYKEGIYVGYRYFDSFGVEPLYPFGHGLSYAAFDISPLECRAAVEAQEEGPAVELRVCVRNTGVPAGGFSGKETVQVYVSAPQGNRDREYKRLATFQKTKLLAPGESQELCLKIDLADLASFREEDACYVLDAGDYIVRVGNSSRNTIPAAVVRLPETVVISRHQHICPLQQPLKEIKPDAPADAAELSADLPVITVDPSAFSTVEYTYEEPPVYADEASRSFVEKLSVKEMAKLVVGAGMFGGKNRFDLPGSVGNTTSDFWDRGLVNIAFCDGPAGLRVQKVSTVDSKGKIKGVEMALSALEAMPGFIKKRMQGNPEKETPLYQFTTAFPVASALAQTWNTELLFEVGSAIYEEMKEYGCTFWLAPAVNIHRNPLCGRNFEYFSEDPFLCGTLAAAMVRGVQKEPGFYVTVKHFACNNQEEERNKVDSVVSERALREIYLKAFEICVRRGGAKGIMTSYNKVNGVYTPVSRDLCTKVLRNEWGFIGVVMTDWFSTMVERGNSALAIGAGNDLIMPGEPLSKRAIINAVRKGTVKEADLRRCCANVVKAIQCSATQKEYKG